jgi:hypothetical protein
MGQYGAAVEGMRRLGLDTTAYNRLRNRTMLAGGLHLAGVGAVTPLPPVSVHHRKTLEAWTRQMVGHLDPQPAVAVTPPAAEEAA